MKDPIKELKSNKEFQAFRTGYMNFVFICYGVAFVYLMTKAGAIDWLLAVLRSMGK